MMSGFSRHVHRGRRNPITENELPIRSCHIRRLVSEASEVFATISQLGLSRPYGLPRRCLHSVCASQGARSGDVNGIRLAVLAGAL